MTEPDKRIVTCELVTLSILITLFCTAIAWVQPSIGSETVQGYQANIGSGSVTLVGWILFQAAALTTWILVTGRFFYRRHTVLIRQVTTTCLLLLPLVMLADSVVFRWTGERFLSFASFRILVDFPSRLAPYATTEMIRDAALSVAITLGVLILILKSSRLLARQWQRCPPSGPVLSGIHCFLTVGLAIALLPLCTPQATLDAMAIDSSRHPFCVFRLLPFRGVHAREQTIEVTADQDRIKTFLARRRFEQRIVTVATDADRDAYPDVLIVVVESFRPELITKEIMPNLWSVAQNSLFCRLHFSGGNATNHGIFSLFNGLEANWYQQPVTYAPLINRIFRDAGYEIGFFAGHNDWRAFLMDGFLDPRHYDTFQCLAPNGLLSDRRSVENAMRFLRRSDGPSTEKPRLAILYLYATHALYQSYAEDQVFQPAADQRFQYPYGPPMREQVWNRYKNSAHTIDRFLGAIMSDDLVMMVTGDHGESFLEDGTIGHGTRISRYQNMTPSVLFVPGRPAHTLDVPTSHVDLLPTLLDGVGISISQGSLFDGLNLFDTTPSQLADRVFATRNYLGEDYGLIGPWTQNPERPFAFRIRISLDPFHIEPLNAIDDAGYAIEDDARAALPDIISPWLEERFMIQAGELNSPDSPSFSISKREGSR